MGYYPQNELESEEKEKKDSTLWTTERESYSGMRRLPRIKKSEFKGSNWTPVTNVPMYHTGNEQTVAEGPGVQIFQRIAENGEKLVGFIPIDPLDETPMKKEDIVLINMKNETVYVVPIIFRFNIQSIVEYEKMVAEKRMQESSMESEEEYCSLKKQHIGSKVTNESYINTLINCHHQLTHMKSSLIPTISRITKIASKLSKAYGLHKKLGVRFDEKNRTFGNEKVHSEKQISIKTNVFRALQDEESDEDEGSDEESELEEEEEGEDFVPEEKQEETDSKSKDVSIFQDEDDNKETGVTIGATVEPEVKTNDASVDLVSKKPSYMLNVAVKYTSGRIRWFSWPRFVLYRTDDSLTPLEKKEIELAIKMLIKSSPATWEVLNVFNE